MSLSKQLSFGFLIILSLMFVGTLWTNTISTRDYIAEQLHANAQDTANSLGLSLAPYLADESDTAVIETMTNAIFDQGHFALVEITNLQGKVLVSREDTVASNEAPAWFTSMFSIPQPTAYSQLNDGWRIHGELKVVSQNGPAYHQLWANAVSNFWLTIVLFALALTFVVILVRRIIQEPIDKVIKQTEAISKTQFEQIQDLPKTTELKNFAVAVNAMSSKLAKIFTQISEQSEKYRLFAYTDSLTKVGNRRAFDLYLQKLLKNGQEHHSGYLFIIRAASLSDINQQQGGVSANEYLQAIVETSRVTASKHFDSFSIHRISGGDFALIVENTDEDNVVELAKSLSLAFKRAEKSEHSSGNAFIGISAFERSQDLASILKNADNALASAYTSDDRWEMSSRLSVCHSNEIWREKIDSVLNEGTADFVAQQIVNVHQQTEYSEWFARVPCHERSEELPMAQLLSASIRFDRVQNLERLIVENLLRQLVIANSNVGLNLSRLSIFDETFMEWFFSKLQAVEEHCHKLVIEISERSLLQDITSLCLQTSRLKTLGVKISVEHFGAQLAGLRHLRKLRPDYLKLDGRYTHRIDKEADNQLFVQSLVNIAHGLEIKIIAEMVETEAEKDWLFAAGVDFVQGYVIEKPSAPQI